MLRVAFIWDFDGVVVETPHEKAWALACKAWGISGFTREFYDKYVSGRPRLEGAANILSYLKHGGRPPSAERLEEVERFAELKTRIYLELLSRGEYRVRVDVVRFIQESRREGALQVLASASKNVRLWQDVEMVPGIRLDNLFDANVSGSAPTKLGVFSNAVVKARELLGEPECLVFFDDAPSGVEAARRLGGKAVGCFNEKLKSSMPDYFVPSFEKLHFRDILSAVGCLP
ncbi:MAG: HAD family phosphatase [Thermofilum sp.]